MQRYHGRLPKVAHNVAHPTGQLFVKVIFQPVGPASLNREMSTLVRLGRTAHGWGRAARMY